MGIIIPYNSKSDFGACKVCGCLQLRQAAIRVPVGKKRAQWLHGGIEGSKSKFSLLLSYLSRRRQFVMTKRERRMTVNFNSTTLKSLPRFLAVDSMSDEHPLPLPHMMSHYRQIAALKSLMMVAT